MTSKVCTRCKQKKLLGDFYRDKSNKDEHTNWCKKCCKEYRQSEKGKAIIKRSNSSKKGKIRRERYSQSEHGKIVKRTWTRSYNGKRHARKQNLRQYGLTLEDYDRILAEQEGCCLICTGHHTKFKWGLVVHHDHKTGKVCGLLCSNCNTGLGMFSNSIDALKRAILLLEEN